jgi:hypothetical protein
MHDQVARVSSFVRERAPHVFCPPCVSRDLKMTEDEVRRRLQIVVAHPASRPHFALTRRLCHGCGRMGDYVARRQ